MNDIKIFQNEQFGQVRIAMNGDEPMFAGIDVANILGYENPQKAIRDHVDEEDRTYCQLSDFQGVNETLPPHMKASKLLVINEGGFYSLIIRSNLPQAKQFAKWVTSEVLPTIRKHGAYLTAEKVEEALLNPDTIIKLAMQLKEERAEKERLAIQNDLQSQQLQISAPKVEYFDTVLQSKSTHNTNNIAKELGMSAVTLNRKLRELGIQYMQGGQWLLISKYQNLGYTTTKTYPYTDSMGKICTRLFTVWTEAGRLFIHKKLGYAS